MDDLFTKNVSYGRDAYNYMRMTESGGVITEFGGVREYYDLTYPQETVLRAMMLGRAFYPDEEQQAVLKELFPSMAKREITTASGTQEVEQDVRPFKHTQDIETLLRHIPAPVLVDIAASLAEKGNGFGYGEYCKVEEGFIDSGSKYIKGYGLMYEFGGESVAEKAGEAGQAAKYAEYKPVDCSGLDDFKDDGARLSEACTDLGVLMREMEAAKETLFPDSQKGIDYGEEKIKTPIDPVAAQLIKP